MISKGKYKHYKGNLYEVLYIAHHSETLEEMVVYKALYETKFGENSIWVRPLSMFAETVEINGVSIQRFQKLDE